MRIEDRLTNPENYGGVRLENIKYIVIQNIGNKFSPHYHIKDGKAIQIIPDVNMSNSVNGGKLNDCGVLHGVCTKYNSISIGVCDNLSKDDKKTCINLIMTLKQRYKVEKNNIIRKKDITGALEPIEWYNDKNWIEEVVKQIVEL